MTRRYLIIVEMPKKHIKPQKVRNAVARLFIGKRRRDSFSAALSEMHPSFKMLLLVYKVRKGQVDSSYNSFNGRRGYYLMLETPNFNTKYEEGVFEYNGSRLWNALSMNIEVEEDIEHDHVTVCGFSEL